MSVSRTPSHRQIAQAFGAVLKIARAGAELSQRELATRAEMARASVSRYERGLQQPTLGVVLRLSAALGVHAGILPRMTAGRLTQNMSDDS
jgi:transcriptional regulator with XRE-family HTH domain